MSTIFTIGHSAIFGKWNLLNRILKEFAIYDFDIVIDKEKNHSNNALSEIVGGNKELCDGITGITLYNKIFMEAFASAGWEVLKEYYQGMLFRLPHILKRPEFEKIYPLLCKLADIGMQLYPKPISFPGNPINFKTRDISSILREMEESFEYEITALYYINFCNDLNKRVPSLSIDNSSKLLNRSPRECLSMILEQDKEGSLREWFTKCMKDLEAFQDDILKITRANMRQIGIE